MRIGLLHGYELSGSGSNEYVRYLSRALAREGHEVEILCREPRPERIPHVGRAWAWDARGRRRELFARDVEGACTVHQLPHGPVRPVYLTDKQREGNVKAFVDCSDRELRQYHAHCVRAVCAVLERHPVDLLHANHLVWQPMVAAETGAPFVVFPHGSAIEYTVRADPRFLAHARKALDAAAGLITGSREVLERIFRLFPRRRRALAAKSRIVGIGVDTDLFAPVPRDQRRASVGRIAPPFTGKPSALADELRARLARGEWEAVEQYRDAYDHGQPDGDLDAKLAGIPWEDGDVCLFVGALTAGKGLQALLAGFPELLPAHLLVVGSGAYREVLEALVHAIATGDQPLFDHLARHGFDLDRSNLAGGWPDVAGAVPRCPALPEHVHFLGRLDHARLRHLFGCADLAVFPSVVPEAYPLVVMEALANGVPPAVSDFSGFRDGLDALEPHLGKELVDGLRLPAKGRGRVRGVARKCAALLKDPAWRRRRARLRRLAVERFDWSVRAREMTAAYESVLSSQA